MGEGPGSLRFGQRRRSPAERWCIRDYERSATGVGVDPILIRRLLVRIITRRPPQSPSAGYGQCGRSWRGRLCGRLPAFRSDSSPLPIPVAQDRADVPELNQRHYNRRHFHVWPSSIETTTLLPLHSQIVPPVTSMAT